MRERNRRGNSIIVFVVFRSLTLTPLSLSLEIGMGSLLSYPFLERQQELRREDDLVQVQRIEAIGDRQRAEAAALQVATSRVNFWYLLASYGTGVGGTPSSALAILFCCCWWWWSWWW